MYFNKSVKCFLNINCSTVIINYGFKSINLGGGNTANKEDSLFKFKLKMSNKKNNFFIYKKILNKKAYKSVVEYWKNSFPKLSEKYKNYLQCYRLID